MAVTHTLPAAFSQSIGKSIVLPPNTKSMVFFGTGGDGNNGNRVPGGLAPINVGSPTISSSFVSVGYNGTISNGINLNVPRDATMLAAGWTWIAVSRATTGTTSGAIIQDAGGAGPPNAGTINGMALQSAASFNTYIHNNITAGVRATFVLPGKNAGNWHFYGHTYSGGALGTYTLNEFTDNVAGSTPASFVGVASMTTGTNSPTVGSQVPNGLSSYQILTDCAFAMVVQGAMLQTDMAAFAASIRPWLARRGIVM